MSEFLNSGEDAPATFQLCRENERLLMHYLGIVSKQMRTDYCLTAHAPCPLRRSRRGKASSVCKPEEIWIGFLVQRVDVDECKGTACLPSILIESSFSKKKKLHEDVLAVREGWESSCLDFIFVGNRAQRCERHKLACYGGREGRL